MATASEHDLPPGRAWHAGDTSRRLGHGWRLAAVCPVGLGLVLLTGGCGLFEGRVYGVHIRNDRTDSVVVSVQGTQEELTATVEPGTLNVIMLDRCRGDALVVTSADGEDIATIDEPACPDKLLRIGPAGSVRLEDH